MITVKYDSSSAQSANNTVFPWDEVKMLSSYEGGSAYDKSGNPKLLDIRMTSNDKLLMLGYFDEGMHLIESALGSLLISEATYSTTHDYVSIILKNTHALRNVTSIPNGIAESLVNYGMFRWLAEKQPDRSEYYHNLFKESLAGLIEIAFQKIRPSRPTYS